MGSTSNDVRSGRRAMRMRHPGDTDVVSVSATTVCRTVVHLRRLTMAVTERAHVVNVFGADHRDRDVEVYYPTPDFDVEVPLE